MRVANLHPTLPSQHSKPRTPKPGEIWQLKQCLYIPAEFSPIGQRRLWYSDNFYSHYVMVVREPEVFIGEQIKWPVLSVMLLSAQTQFLSAVDLLLPKTVSGLASDLLVETWHVQFTLVSNLSHPVGTRLSRDLYDLLLSVGDCYLGLSSDLPPSSEIRSLGLRAGTLAAEDPSIHAFHQQETHFSEHLRLLPPVNSVQSQAIALTAALIDESIRWQQDLDDLCLGAVPMPSDRTGPVSSCISFHQPMPSTSPYP